jgi:DNA-binding PadR family transcriptional regulator
VSTTRLLVLGVVRIFQPVLGNHVRRELLSWDAASWAHVQPGSVYHALRQGVADGLLTVDDDALYSLTSDGVAAFDGLLRQAVWEVAPHDPERLLSGLAFLPWWPRTELVDALEGRAAVLSATLVALGHQREALRAYPEKQHVPEMVGLTTARLEGELRFVEGLAARLRAGEHVLLGEGGPAG